MNSDTLTEGNAERILQELEADYGDVFERLWAVFDDLTSKRDYQKLLALNAILSAQVSSAAGNGRAVEAEHRAKGEEVNRDKDLHFIAWQRCSGHFPQRTSWMENDEVLGPALKPGIIKAEAEWPEVAGYA